MSLCKLPHSAIVFRALLAGLSSFAIPFRFGQAEEAVANLPLRMTVRAH